jgi:xanthosine utilization system XapX-like protein
MGGLEHTAGASAYTTASMVAAMVTVAVLPVFIHLASHISKTIAAVLFVGFLGFLVYSVPATLGRVGEVKEAKTLGKHDAEHIRAQLEDVKRTLSFAQPDLAKECRVVGPECRRKQTTVDALIKESIKFNDDLRSLGHSRLGDVGSNTLAWVMAGSVSPEAIAKVSGLGIVLGLETVIWAMVWLATAAVQKAWNMALAKISPGECSKRVQEAVGLGILQKQRAGREVAITLH